MWRGLETRERLAYSEEFICIHLTNIFLFLTAKERHIPFKMEQDDILLRANKPGDDILLRANKRGMIYF
jgi:hypothetical protein